MTTETKSNTISLSLMAALIAALVTGVAMHGGICRHSV